MEYLLEGIVNNFLITLLASLVPIGVGVLFSFLPNETARKIFSWITLPFEALCPVVCLVCTYYLSAVMFSARLDAVLFTIITFSVCFLGYIPARYHASDSRLKNLLYHGLGLVSTVFCWSCCIGFIAGLDLLRAAQNMMSITYDPMVFILPLILSLVILGMLQVAKKLVKDLMK